MLINLSNHSSLNWDELQQQAAAIYGQTVDLPFPSIDPEADTDTIVMRVEQYEGIIRELLSRENSGAFVVHVMGELTFCFALVARLQKIGITCLASTSLRETEENPDGTKTVKFGFVRFREYPTLSK